MPITNFTQLLVYKECRKFRKRVASLTQFFPKQEQNLLRSRILDSSRSVTANIAEGYGRYRIQDNIQFCLKSRGALLKTYEYLIIAYDHKYFNRKILQEVIADYNRCLKLLNDYISYLKKT